MKRSLIYLLCLGGLLGACRDRMTCPEYQSRYILDDEYRTAFFALFDEDSLPKQMPLAERTATWYGTVKKKGWLERKHEIETVKMEKVFAPLEDTDTLSFEASDFVQTGDSTGVDMAVGAVDTTAAVVPPAGGVDISSTNGNAAVDYAIVSAATEGEKTYNVEQNMYMMYVGGEIMRKRQAAYEAWQKAEAERMEEERQKDSVRSARRERWKAFWSFGRNKKKDEVEPEEVYDPFLDYGDDEPALPGEEDQGTPQNEEDEEQDEEDQGGNNGN